MARAKRGVKLRRRHKKWLKLAKGNFAARRFMRILIYRKWRGWIEFKRRRDSLGIARKPVAVRRRVGRRESAARLGQAQQTGHCDDA